MNKIQELVLDYLLENDRIQVTEFAKKFEINDFVALQEIGTTLAANGWTRKQVRDGQKRIWYYTKPAKVAHDLLALTLVNIVTNLIPNWQLAERLVPDFATQRVNLSSYTGFCQSIGVELGHGQLQIATCAYDGGDMPGGPTFGNCVGPVDTLARQIVIAVCGARGGKTRTLIALRILYGALTRDLGGLGKGEEAFGLIVAPRLPLAKQALRYISGEIAANAYLSALVERENAESITLRREDGGVVTIIVMPATAKGTALRGMSLTDAAFDESAFFRDSDYQISDVELFKAVSPRVMMGGQMIIASTPWAKSGLLWDYFDANFGKPKTAIAVHAPSLALRYDKKLEMLIELERQRDPDNARREYDAEFLTTGTGAYFDADRIDGCIDAELDSACDWHGGRIYAAGADFGFVNDSSALVVVEFDGQRYRTVAIVELRPDNGALVPSEVVACFAMVLKRFGLRHVVSDIHYREAIRELLKDHDIDLISAPEGRYGKTESYARAKSMMHEGRVRIPCNQKLIRQLKDIRSRPTTGGGMIIESPRRNGGHGDIVSAWVLAMWRQTHSRIVEHKERDEFDIFAPAPRFDVEKEVKMITENALARYGTKRTEDW